MLGAALLLLGAVVLIRLAWLQRSEGLPAAEPVHPVGAALPQSRQAGTPAAAMPSMPWPTEASTHQLTARLAQLAAGAGLALPRAEYRYLPGTAELPPVIEVQCAFKHAYPAVRRFMVSVLREWPSSTVRELQVQRSSTEAPEVEARLTVAFFLDEPEAVAKPVGALVSKRGTQ